jgi:LysR family transcriptional regulator, regulator for bpeEF and oprC
MNDRSGMDLAAIGAFVRVGETGGFRSAAAALGMSSAGVSKAVARLEAQLGVTLVARTTRSVRLTPAGVAFHARCKAILFELGQAAEEAGEASIAPHGRLRISMPVSYGRMRVLPVVTRYVERYRDVEVDVRLSDRVADLVDDGFDLAIRIGFLPDSSLVATRVAETGFVLCASPSYLARTSLPLRPDDLTGHTFVGYVTPGTANRFVYRFLVDGAIRSVTFPSRLTADDGEALVAAALGSAGLVMVADYLAERHISEGRLVRVLREFEMPPAPVSVVQVANRHASPAVRALTRMLRDAESRHLPSPSDA